MVAEADNPPSVMTTTSARGWPRSTSSARCSPGRSWAPKCVVLRESMASRSTRASVVSGERGVAVWSSCAICKRSAGPSPSIKRRSSASAASKREGSTSVADMDALASTNTKSERPWAVAPA